MPAIPNSYTRLILALDIIRKPTVWGLLLENILAYMTLGALLSAHARTTVGVLQVSGGCDN